MHLANILTKKLEIGFAYETSIPEPDELVYSYLGITPEVIERLMEDLSGAQDEIDEFFQYLNG